MLEVVNEASATPLTASLELTGMAGPGSSSVQLWPQLLVQLRDASTAVAGIVVFYFGVSDPVRLPNELALVLAGALIEASDVEPKIISGSARTVRS